MCSKQYTKSITKCSSICVCTCSHTATAETVLLVCDNSEAPDEPWSDDGWGTGERKPHDSTNNYKKYSKDCRQQTVVIHTSHVIDTAIKELFIRKINNIISKTAKL